jgi:hypothetical protein
VYCKLCILEHDVCSNKVNGEAADNVQPCSTGERTVWLPKASSASRLKYGRRRERRGGRSSICLRGLGSVY